MPKKPKPKARKAPPSTSTRTKPFREGSKLKAIVGLLKRPQGCTTAEILKATGWPAVSVPQQARAAGLTLRKERGEDGRFRFWGT